MMARRSFLGRCVTAAAGIVLAPLSEAALSDEIPPYTDEGRDWDRVVDGAEICGRGKEQSPIDLATEEVYLSQKMELNGYGYENFNAVKSDISLPTYRVLVDSGEFILNLYDGKK